MGGIATVDVFSSWDSQLDLSDSGRKPKIQAATDLLPQVLSVLMSFASMSFHSATALEDPASTAGSPCGRANKHLRPSEFWLGEQTKQVDPPGLCKMC